MAKSLSRGKKIALLVGVLVAVLGGVFWWALPGLARLRGYNKMMSHAVLGKCLAVVPEKLDVSPTDTKIKEPLSIGYAHLPITASSVKKIESAPGDSLVTVETESATFTFMTPFSYGSYEEFKKDAVASEDAMAEAVTQATGGAVAYEKHDPSAVEGDPVTARMTREMIEDPFAWGVRVAETMPKTRGEIFFMSADAWKEYFLLAVQKANDWTAQRGLLVFEARSVRGILHLGAGDRPGMMFATVYARESRVQQGIYIKAETHAAARKAFLGLMAGFSYTLEKVPGDEELGKLVHRAVDGHPKYAERKDEFEDE